MKAKDTLHESVPHLKHLTKLEYQVTLPRIWPGHLRRIDWLNSSAIHHFTSDFVNVAVHSEYQGPKKVILDNGSKLSISHPGKNFITASDKKSTLDNILHVIAGT